MHGKNTSLGVTIIVLPLIAFLSLTFLYSYLTADFFFLLKGATDPGLPSYFYTVFNALVALTGLLVLTMFPIGLAMVAVDLLQPRPRLQTPA